MGDLKCVRNLSLSDRLTSPDPQQHSASMDLKELLAQREAVARHLAWLDAQITAHLRGTPQGTVTNLPAQAAPPPPASAEAPARPDPISTVLEQSLAREQPIFTQVHRLGCLAIGLLLTMGAIALLFGLPYLIYSR